MNIYERMRAGEWIDRLTDKEYSTTAKAQEAQKEGLNEQG